MVEGTYTVFREVQRFQQKWLWLVILLLVVFTWYSAFEQLVLKRPIGNNPASDTGMLIIWLIFGIGLPYVFYSLKLETEVRSDGIYFRFHLIHRRFHRIGLAEIKHYEARTYSAIKEYGGYGIRAGRRGTAYTVSGNRGVQLELTNGKQILFGSQRAEEFVLAIDSICR